jgi:hypothetical protein
MRSHPVFTAFQRRWQLSVYFQLRWKEIITKLEEILSSRILDPEAPNFTPGELPLTWFQNMSLANHSQGRNEFVTAQAADIFSAIASCWSAEVYIPDLAHRFWKFTLQVLPPYWSSGVEVNTFLAPQSISGMVRKLTATCRRVSSKTCQHYE